MLELVIALFDVHIEVLLENVKRGYRAFELEVIRLLEDTQVLLE